jgi:two-component system phosphate regulon response regulator PhoB
MAHILLAEDEANIHTLINFRMRRLGHTITWVQDGGQALAAARANSPDLILLDVMMPVFDGFQVLKQLKADASLRDIPVIMLTARGHEKDVVGGIEGGADDYVVKPFSFPELIARVNAALARSTRGKQ